MSIEKIRNLEKEIEAQAEVIRLENEEIKELKIEIKERKKAAKDLFKIIDQYRQEIFLKTITKKTVEMPYVRVKVNRVISAKYPKTDLTISAGGALEQIDFDDVSTFINSLIEKIGVEMDDAIQKLNVEEEPIQ